MLVKQILILDKDLAMCQWLSNFLKDNGFVVVSTCCEKEAIHLIKSTDFALILCDSELKNTYPVDFLLKIKALRPAVPIISISDTENIQTAVELMKNGAYYFMLKPIDSDRLLEVATLAIKTTEDDFMHPSKPMGSFVPQIRKIERVTEKLISPVTKQGYPYVIGKSLASVNLYKSIKLVAPTDYTVIIRGETGTGKEAVARIIHEQSHRHRHKGPFLAVDCGSLSKELAASELFGHEKGAFTGALQNREGAFILASGGTLFLDEIGNLSYDVQLLLLRAIQERVVRKVGCSLETPVNVRVIVATNEDLKEAVNKRKFREDLFHRLNEFSLMVPALRERIEDLPLFVAAFVSHAAQKLKKDIQVPTGHAMAILSAYHWPGNIRELLNTVKKACLFTPEREPISEQYLPCEIKMVSSYVSDMGQKSHAIYPALHTTGTTHHPAGKIINTDKSLKDIAADAELDKIVNTLKSVKYNKSKAAQLLNIDRKTLYNKLKKINR